MDFISGDTRISARNLLDPPHPQSLCSYYFAGNGRWSMRTSAKKPTSAGARIATSRLGRNRNSVSSLPSVRNESTVAAGMSSNFSAIPVRSAPPTTTQPKVRMNVPGDVHEQEAEAAAERVAGPPPSLRAGSGAPISAAPPAQRKVQGVAGQSQAAPAGVREALSSTGQPLDYETRARMEPRFGQDFSRVRVHTDARAAESAHAAGALAYTVGPDIVFGSGQYAPRTTAGARLLAHELTHTVQQGLAAHEAGSGHAGAFLMQRQQAAAPPAAATTPAQIYAQALGKLKALDPTLYGYLSKATLGGGPTTIMTDVTQGQPGVPSLTVAINLDVKLAPLAANKDAEFSPGTITRPAAAGAPFVFGFNMTINQSMPADTVPDMVAEVLVHEGTHLQIAMDKVVYNPSNKSPHEAGFGKYQTTAKSLASYGNLLIYLNNYMEMVLTKHKQPTDEATRQKDAQKIVDLLVEEKYVYDQDKAKFGQGRTNSQLAADYIKDGLDAVGILPSANLPNLNNVLLNAEDFLDELDAQLKPPPAPTKPAQAPGGGKP